MKRTQQTLKPCVSLDIVFLLGLCLILFGEVRHVQPPLAQFLALRTGEAGEALWRSPPPCAATLYRYRRYLYP